MWEDFRFRPPYRLQNRLIFASVAALVLAVVLTKVFPRAIYQHPIFAAGAILAIFGPFIILGLASVLYRSFFIGSPRTAAAILERSKLHSSSSLFVGPLRLFRTALYLAITREAVGTGFPIRA
jgi:hypothetical protein